MSQIFFDLLSRVHTFTVSNWIYTTLDQLNPYVLASQGYHLNKPRNLECTICHHEISLPKQIQDNITQIEQQLKRHKQNCIYHESNSIEASVLPPFSKEQVYLLIDEIILKIKPTYQLLTQFPVINNVQISRYIKVDQLTLKFISQAYKLNWPENIKITFFLLIFGWAVKQSEDNQLKFYCNFCGRQLNIQKFKCLNTDSQSKALDVKQTQSFDPVSQHRYFCFWVNKQPFLECQGFEIILQQIYDKINESKTLFSKRQPQQTKKIRVEVDKYLQNFQLKTSQQFNKIKSIFNECQNMRKSLQTEQKNNQFQNTEKRMNEFVNHNIGQQIKGQIKKIKLN